MNEPSTSRVLKADDVNDWLLSGDADFRSAQAWHACSPSAAERIRQEGFRPGSRGKFGAGVYLTIGEPDAGFGPSVVPAAVKLTNPLRHDLHKPSDVYAQLELDITMELGRLKQRMSQHEREIEVAKRIVPCLRRMGHDGVVFAAESPAHQEVVVYDLRAVAVILD
ncbi:MAG TPA: hypothetical protein VF529_03495 [Solirubrobacteraceae bacterium]